MRALTQNNHRIASPRTKLAPSDSPPLRTHLWVDAMRCDCMSVHTSTRLARLSPTIHVHIVHPLVHVPTSRPRPDLHFRPSPSRSGFGFAVGTGWSTITQTCPPPSGTKGKLQGLRSLHSRLRRAVGGPPVALIITNGSHTSYVIYAVNIGVVCVQCMCVAKPMGGCLG